jgi:hypothetical protein
MDVIGIGKFLEEELREYEPTILKTVYPELWGYEGLRFPTMGNLALGLRSIMHARMDHVGRAVNYGGKATSIPLVNFGITMEESKTIVGVLGAEWTYFDLEAERTAKKFPQLLQQRNLVQEYRNALERGLREWMHIKSWAGDAQAGIAGFFSNPDVTVINETQNLYTMTPGQLHNWWIDLLTSYRMSNRLTAEASSVLISEPLRAAMTRRFGDGSSDGTPLKMVRDELLTNVNVVNELSSAYLEEFGVVAPGTNKDLIILYENQPSVLDRRYYPIEVTAPGLLDDQLTYRVVGFCATSEARIKQPMRVKYILHPKSTMAIAV